MFQKPTVFVLDAGASYGDTLVSKYDNEESLSGIPLINQFFDSAYMFDEPSVVESTYSDLVGYLEKGWRIRDAFGTGKWSSLNLEDIFTALAIDYEFAIEGTDYEAEAQLRLSTLKTYIRRSICRRSIGKFGKLTQQLVEHLRPQDSIITFNYDLLVDYEFLERSDGKLHYERFYDKLFHQSFRGRGMTSSFDREQGMYLKLHGSLNWFVCNNTLCPNSSKLKVFPGADQILGAQDEASPACDICERALSAYLVGPLLNKPIMRDWISSVVWSNALSVLRSASKIVVIGYSFPATDFYSEWLFRAALWGRGNPEVWVINPLNSPDCPETDPETRADYQVNRSAFLKRVDNTITTLWGYNSDYCRFEQLTDVFAPL